MSLRKVSCEAFFFSVFSRNQEKKEATDLAVSQLRGSAIAVISAHVPSQHMWASAGPGLSSSSPKQWKSDGRVKIYNSVSERVPLTKSKKKKIIESAAIQKLSKSARVSALTGSVPCKMAKALQSFITHQKSNPCRPTLCDQP